MSETASDISIEPTIDQLVALRSLQQYWEHDYTDPELIFREDDPAELQILQGVPSL